MAQVSGIEVRFSGNTQPLEQAVGKAEGALNSFGKTASNVIPANFRSKVQQASYQIQDFAVQVASGTSATRAFAQQAPQLLSGFGLVGTILGTVAAIAVPLAAAFLDNSTNSLSFADAAEEAAKKVDALGKSLELMAMRLNDNATKTGVLTEQLVALQRVKLAADAAASVDALRTSFKSLGSEMQGWSGIWSSFQVSIGNANEALSGVSAGVLALIPGLSRARGGIISATTDTAREIVGLTATVRSWGVEADTAVRLAIDLSNAFSNTNSVEAAKQLADVAFRLQNISTISPEAKKQIDGFFSSVTALSEGTADLNKNLAATAALMQSGMMGGIGSYGESNAMSGSTISKRPADKKKKKGPKPDISPSQQEGMYFVDRLTLIRESFKKELQLRNEQYAEDQAVLENALINKRITEEAYYEDSKKLAKQHSDDIRKIQATTWAINLGAASDFFGSMAQIFEMGGKKTTKIAKVFAIAQALISTFQGAAKALTLPFPANLAAYATTLAQGLSAVASIKSINENGGGGGSVGGKGGKGSAAGSGGGGGAGGGGGPTTTFQFTLMNDPMGFGEKFARQFIDQLNSTQRNGGQIRGVIA